MVFLKKEDASKYVHNHKPPLNGGFVVNMESRLMDKFIPLLGELHGSKF